MTHEEYQKAAEHWKIRDADNKEMPRADVLSVAEAYICKNNTCALATGNGTFVRCTPIEYTYRDSAFWMFSEGGEKFAALEYNKNVCLAIFDKYDGFENLKGMQVTGIAEIIVPFSKEYTAAAEFKKIPVDVLKKLPTPMNLIKITPVKIDFLNSDFKKNGFSARQKISF